MDNIVTTTCVKKNYLILIPRLSDLHPVDEVRHRLFIMHWSSTSFVPINLENETKVTVLFPLDRHTHTHSMTQNSNIDNF